MRLVLIGVLLLVTALEADASRIKDIASFDGSRENQLIGYGLVVGLNGTGDSDQAKFPSQSLLAALEKGGVTVAKGEFTVKNVAAVMVTAQLPPFARQGTKLDVVVSSLGDAKSVAGGTLLMTALRGADGQAYAVAQGQVLTATFAYAGSGGQSRTHPTVGRVSSGALVEREIADQLPQRSTVRLNLGSPDFTTAERVADAINAEFGAKVAAPLDAGAVSLNVPADEGLVSFMARVERVEVQQDAVARVIINERTGTLVLGENVTIRPVSLAHGSLSIKVREAAPAAAKLPPPPPGSSSLQGREEERRVVTLPASATVADLVKVLNALGVTPRDLIGIMQSIKAAGALAAEIVVI